MKVPECPCGSARPLSRCCGRLHRGEPAPDAEALMRSRYVAYVLRDEAYLLATWHASTRPDRIGFEAGAQTRWLGLEVRSHRVTGEHTATVEFVARCRIAGRAQRMHETSRFTLEEGRWYYIDGAFHE